MSIALRQMAAGPKFTIYAMEEFADQAPPERGAEPAGNCPVLTFWNQCKDEDIAQLAKRLDSTAQHGPSWNPEQCRQLTPDIWEFKTGRGLRLLWFYDKGQMVICTSGYIKKKQKADPREIKRAEEWKAKYDLAKKLNKLSISQDDFPS
jgi:Phage derived protein Gp49-like (DUF891)